LRISPFLIPDVPNPPTCIAASSSQLRMRRREKPFRYGRCPLRSRAKLQFAGRPFETICKCRGQSIAAAARASISRESVLMQERDVECYDRSSKEQKTARLLAMRYLATAVLVDRSWMSCKGRDRVDNQRSHHA